MKSDRLALGLLLGILSAMGWSEGAIARPVADTSLGLERSIVTPLLLSPGTDRIDGGAIRGINLFHSFTRFNIEEGRVVNFSNPT